MSGRLASLLVFDSNVAWQCGQFYLNRLEEEQLRKSVFCFFYLHLEAMASSLSVLQPVHCFSEFKTKRWHCRDSPFAWRRWQKGGLKCTRSQMQGSPTNENSKDSRNENTHSSNNSNRNDEHKAWSKNTCDITEETTDVYLNKARVVDWADRLITDQHFVAGHILVSVPRENVN